MMSLLEWNPLRRWFMSAFEAPAPARPLVFRPPAVRARRIPPAPVQPAARPVTPFRPVAQALPTDLRHEAARREAQRFWLTLDPDDRRRAAIGGSFAQVCAALETLAEVEHAIQR